MADYYPLLARALESLPEKTQDARNLVYQRAKAALAGQLRSIQPPLAEDAVTRELASLDDAIARIERAEAVPAPEAAPATEPRIERPKVDPSRIRAGGRRNRSVLTAAGLAAAIVPIAVLAWLWRDRPAPEAPPVQPPAAQPGSPQAGSDPKFPERVGAGSGGASPAAPDPSRPADGTAPAQPGLAVAQKAALIEENPQDPQQPKMAPGRAFWRLDAVNGGQGEPLETVVRATVEVPQAGMSLLLTLKRNRDTALPASHTMELSFTTPAGDSGRVVRDVNPPLFRTDDGSRGVPLAALSVPVKENLFLIGLSDLRSDVERNTELIRNRNWIEIPVRFASGTRATLVFEKGVAGERVIADAFNAWTQP